MSDPLTVSEAAARLGVSRNVAYESVRRGEIPSVRLGRRIVIPRQRLLESLGATEPGVTPSRDVEPGPAQGLPDRGERAAAPAHLAALLQAGEGPTVELRLTMKVDPEAARALALALFGLQLSSLPS